MDLSKLTQKEKETLEDIINEKLYLIKKMEEDVQFIEDFYSREFEEIDEILKEELANDETIPDEELGKIYLEEIEKVKGEIFEMAKEKLFEVREEYTFKVEQ